MCNTLAKKLLDKDKIQFAFAPSSLILANYFQPLNAALYLRRLMSNSKEFEIVLPFAGEDREYVVQIANLLKDLGVKVFYDLFLKKPFQN